MLRYTSHILNLCITHKKKKVPWSNCSFFLYFTFFLSIKLTHDCHCKNMQRSNDFQLYHPEGKNINVSCSDTMFSSVRQSCWTWSPNPVGENRAAPFWATCLFLEIQQYPRKEGDTAWGVLRPANQKCSFNRHLALTSQSQARLSLKNFS